jgi:hypothetical protein
MFVYHGLVDIVRMSSMGCKLYCADKIRYIYGRPVLKVEFVERKDGKVTFLTDYPVEEISIDEELFDKHFHRW